MFNNDENNPIKEYGEFRKGIKYFEDDFKINNDYAPTDLHDCSNDLSDKGSRKEEFEHAEFTKNIKNNKKYEKTVNSYNTKKFTFFKLMIIIILSIFIARFIFYAAITAYAVIMFNGY